jgi:hypothetical protein
LLSGSRERNCNAINVYVAEQLIIIMRVWVLEIGKQSVNYAGGHINSDECFLNTLRREKNSQLSF